MKYALGTVQLGLDYGIANKSGKPSQNNAFKILDHAYDIGVDYLDTAIAYGESEKIIGLWRKKTNKEVPIITKIAHLNQNDSLKDEIRNIVYSSLKRLHVDCLHGVLLHNYELFEEYGPDIFYELESLKQKGYLKHFGISIYNANQLRDISDISSDISIVQGGVNVFDDDFSCLQSEKKYTFFARSIFLQGLFFLGVSEAEKKVKGSGVFISTLKKLSMDINVSIPEIAMRYVISKKNIHSVVIGAESVGQLDESFRLFQKGVLHKNIIKEIESSFSDIPDEIRKPNLWSNG